MKEQRAICTIIAKNYTASARTLAQSFLKFHADYRCYVLVVDDFEGYINPQDECFEIIKLSDLEIPNLPDFCFKYDVQELCTAVKAHLLGYLINEKRIDKLLYLDPDILVTGSLEALYEKLEANDIILTPHLDADYPEDDLLPNDGYILRAGQFNLGFIGVNSSPNAQSFLNWWKSKLYEKCVVDLMNGYFVDQKFIDFVPLFFDNVLIEKNVGYNVAFWNLHSRKIGNHNGQWTCNDEPLWFFHFSGYKPESTNISNHIQNGLARYNFSNRRDLLILFSEYQRLLIENGYRQTNSWPYTYGQFASGEPISSRHRIHYRTLPASRRRLSNPFESEELERWLKVELRPYNREDHLQAILNSRAWRWVSRYGRLKSRFLTAISAVFDRLFRARRKVSNRKKR